MLSPDHQHGLGHAALADLLHHAQHAGQLVLHDPLLLLDPSLNMLEVCLGDRLTVSLYLLNLPLDLTDMDDGADRGLLLTDYLAGPWSSW